MHFRQATAKSIPIFYRMLCMQDISYYLYLDGQKRGHFEIMPYSYIDKVKPSDRFSKTVMHASFILLFCIVSTYTWCAAKVVDM